MPLSLLPTRLRRFFPLALLATLLPTLALTATAARTGTLDADQIKETVFPSGLRLIVKESRASDLASVQVWIRAGGFLETEETAGTSHVIEHLVFKGGEREGLLDIEIENLGGLLEASTEKDWTNFRCTVSGRFAGKVIQTIGQALRNPTFREQDYEAEKGVIREEIDQVRIDPTATLARALYDLAYQSHPYRHDVRGTVRFLNTLKVPDLAAFYKKHYTPANTLVVVVGDVDPTGVERAVRNAFQADTPAPTVTQTLPAEERPCSRTERRVLQGGFNTGLVGLAYTAPSVKDGTDPHVMDVILTLLESSGSGRLPRAMSRIGPVQAIYETRRQAGLLVIRAAAGQTDVEQVEQLLRREIELLTRELVPENELNFAKRALRGDYMLDNETYSGQASTLGYYAAIDRWQFASEYPAKVNAVTAEQVRDVAQKYLAGNSAAVLLRPRPRQPGVGPTGRQ